MNNELGATLDSTNLGNYDDLLQSCLDTGARCMIDINNFARWDGEIIGQGGPTDDQFVDFWTQLATKYADSENVVFELMNEPHDLDIDVWAQTCQKVVTAVRNAGATSQIILLPGTGYDSAATLVSDGSAAALLNITNPDGTTDNLVLDIHKYLDEDNSGTHEECTTDNVDALTEIGQFLRDNSRLGLISETGASGSDSCLTKFCSQNQFINENSDVFLGLVAWAAGSFSPNDTLSLTPSQQDGEYVDSTLMTQCVLGTWTSGSSSSTVPTNSTGIFTNSTTSAGGSADSSSSDDSASYSTGPSLTNSTGSASTNSTGSSNSTSTSVSYSIGTGTAVLYPTNSTVSSTASITELLTAPTSTVTDSYESIVESGTSIIETDTLSLDTMTTLLMATGLPPHRPAQTTNYFAYATATGTADATDSASSASSTGSTSSNVSSGASLAAAPSSLVLGGLTVCGILAVLAL